VNASDSAFSISVLVCTRNRVASLKRLLLSLRDAWRGALPGDELVVVDNGSSDGTPDLIADLVSSLSGRVIVEPTLGLSHARNAAWRAARGGLCVFVDDDCKVPSGWLAAWHCGHERWRAAFYGAPIIATFEPRQPRWASPETYGFLYGHYDPKALEGPCDISPWGGNMGVRRGLFTGLGGFDPRLGMKGRSLLAGEETAFFIKATGQGSHGVFLPDAWTWHVNDRHRLTWGYAWRRSVAQGRTMAVMSDWASGHRATPFRTTWGRFGGNLIGAGKTCIRRPSWQAFGRLWVQTALACGHCHQLRS
jgi:glucosyl-dolichyl phosphate glucuronosyltransferase